MPPGDNLYGPILIGAWIDDEEFPVHPKGSQPKRTLLCPSDPVLSGLIPEHRYIFKTAKVAWQSMQCWSEVIAYQIGSAIGLKLPPCYMAVDDSDGQNGVLMEFFYGYPAEAEPYRLMHASDFLSRLIVDKRRGAPIAFA